MGISTRTEYATRALLDLALMDGTRHVKTSDIARRQHIPKKYLEQILLMFKNEGLVLSKPGLHGGFTLARPASQISIAEVVRAAEGPLAPVRCVSETAYAPCTCPDEGTCPLRDTWRQARDAMVSVLEKVTLADVAGRARKTSAGR